MKKLISALLLVTLLIGLAVPAMATNMEILFTPGSSAEAGSFLEIDFNAMMMDGRVTADIYNSILEGNYEIYWYRDASFYSTQPRVNFSAEDKGITYSVEIRFYGDAACTVLWETLYSPDFTITSNEPPMVLYTTQVSDGAVGMYYSFQFEASDPDATFSLFRSSAPDGLMFEPDGTLSGVPTKAGTYVMNVVAKGVGGEASYSYEINIGGELQETKIMTAYLPHAVVGRDYYVQLECSDKAASFGIYYNPGRANEFEATGLTMTPGGVISGKPTKAGVYTFWVGAYGEANDDYKELQLTIDPAEDEPEPTKTPEPTEEPDDTKAPGKDKNDKNDKTGKNDKNNKVEDTGDDKDSDASESTDKQETEKDGADAEKPGIDLKVVIAILAGVLLAAIVVIVILLTKKKK